MEIKKVETIALGSDHAGYNMKCKIKAHLEARGIQVLDMGTDAPVSCNYTIFAHAVCEAVTEGKAPLGILVCGTGIGMSMAANKHAGIRAACCENTFSARMTRMHNDANMLAMGARVVGVDLGRMIAEIFLTTGFEGGRHQRRIDQIMAIEAGEIL